ncbi:MAG TPA: hypothetical protein VEG32_03945 [Clostridia bacterium]|nr:hypothetical protein [Clostridia bacterium]
MGSVRGVRRIMLAIVTLCLLADVAAVGVLLSPIGRSRAERQQEYDRLRSEMIETRRESLPARDMDKKLETARMQVGEFYRDRLPARYSEVADVLGKLSKAHGVRLSAIRYDSKNQKNQIPGLQHVEVRVSMTGDYASCVRFINALEREKTLFVLSQVNFAGAGTGPGVAANDVRVEISVDTYMREAA